VTLKRVPLSLPAPDRIGLEQRVPFGQSAANDFRPFYEHNTRFAFDFPTAFPRAVSHRGRRMRGRRQDLGRRALRSVDNAAVDLVDPLQQAAD
jgi:hypothetical protein